MQTFPHQTREEPGWCLARIVLKHCSMAALPFRCIGLPFEQRTRILKDATQLPPFVRSASCHPHVTAVNRRWPCRSCGFFRSIALRYSSEPNRLLEAAPSKLSWLWSTVGAFCSS